MRAFRLLIPSLLICSALHAQQKPSFTPVTSKMLQEPAPADWLMWRRTLNSWGFSPLNQINRANVGRITLVWTRGMGPGIQEGAPLVHQGVLYLPNPSDYIQDALVNERHAFLNPGSHAARSP